MKYLYQRNNGIITKYIQIEDKFYVDAITLLKVNRDEVLLLGTVSENIIDLIEVGDYVNGHLIVNEIYGEDDNELYFEIEGGFNKAKYIGEKDIKSIVTKEQFESIEYKV